MTNKTITCCICDADNAVHAAFEEIAGQHFGNKLTIVGKATHLFEAFVLMVKYKPQILFYGLQDTLPQADLLPSPLIYNAPFDVAIMAPDYRFVEEAQKLGVIDFLLKPLTAEKIAKTLTLHKKRVSAAAAAEISAPKSPPAALRQESERIALPVISGFRIEFAYNILYCQADQSYTRVYLANGEMVLVSKPLLYLNQILTDKRFFRIHKSYLINLGHVTSFSKGNQYRVILSNGISLEVAHRRKNMFLRAMNL